MQMSAIKKTFTFILCAIFIYNTLGFLLIHPFLENQIKKLGISEATNPSENSSIEKIELKKEDIIQGQINFERIDKYEFRLEGKMYDIVEVEETDLVFIFYCINDEKEDEFEKQFEKKLEDNLANKKQKSAKNNLINLLISEAVSYISNNSIKNFKSIHRLDYIMNYDSINRDIPSPPPKSFLFV